MFEALKSKRIDMGENMDRGLFTDCELNESAVSESQFDE